MPLSTDERKRLWLGRACLAVMLTGALCWLLAPAGPEADYAGTGLLLAPSNYGLIVPLVGFGAAAADLEALLLVETLALFLAGLAVAACLSEEMLLAHQDALSFIVRYPVTNCAMAFFGGAALLVGGRGRAIPLALSALLMGAAFGTTLGLYSPGDDAARWFLVPGAVAGFALVLVSAFSLTRLKAPWWSIARNIVGSWLIATAVLLAGFPLVPKRSQPPELPQSQDAEPVPLPKSGSKAIELPQPALPQTPGFDPSRQP